MKLVATAGEDKTARIWDFETGKQLFELKHEGRVNSIAFSPDSQLLLTGDEDKIARLYSTRNGKEEKQFVGHTGEITSVAYSPDGKRVLTGSMDSTIHLWNSENGNEISKLNEDQPIGAVNFASSQKVVYATRFIDEEGIGFNPTIYLWTGNANEKPSQLTETMDSAISLAITPDAKRILIGSETYAASVSIRDISNENKVRELAGESNVINSIDISPDNKFVMTGEDKMIPDLWNLTTGQKLNWWLEKFNSKEKKISSNKDFPNSKTVAFSPKGKYLAFSQNSNFLIYTAEDFNIVRIGRSFKYRNEESDNSMNNDEVQTIKFSSEENFVFVGFKSGEGQLINLNTKEWIVFAGTDTRPYPDTLEQFRPKPKIIYSFDDSFYPINSASFSPDEKVILMVGEGGHKVVFRNIELSKEKALKNTESGEERRYIVDEKVIKNFLTPVWSVDFSPDGKTIATASGGAIDMSKIGIGDAANANGVQFFDVETDKKIESFGGDLKISSNKFAGFKSVAYSPDGNFLAAGSFDGKVYLRNNETKELRKFEGHTDAVNSVKFAKDANDKLLVVSGSSDSTTRIWDAATGEEICALVTFRDGNWAVVQTKAGRYDAPNGGEIEGIQWVFGNETIELKQLKDIYYTPNLLPRLLGYNKEPLAAVRPLSEIKLFPEITAQNFDKQTGNLNVKLKNRGGGIGAVRIMVNGLLAAEDARSTELKEQLKKNPNLAEAVVNYNIKSSAGFNPKGENRIEVITNDFDQKTQKSFVSSNPKTSARGTEIINLSNPADELKKPTLYAVVGGVSDYNGSALDLNFAAKDAESFANALGVSARRLFCPKENPNCTDKVKIKLLSTPPKGETKAANELPTKPNFEAAFREIAQTAKPEDVIVVYLAGHGTSLNVGDTETYFYLTQESENGSKEAVSKNPERAISNTEILDWLTQKNWRTDKKGIDAQNKVLILDTCAAGAFEKVLTRDLSADQIRALEKLKDRSGLQILMGSAANQSAYEASQYGQGLLTYALLFGMKGAALKSDSSVETGTLFDFAVNQVPKMDIANGTIGLQSPRVFGSTGIPIGLMPTKEDRDQIKILESPLPIFSRPSLIKKGENDDTLDLGIAFAKRLEEASNPQTRGDIANRTAGALVFVDQRNLPGAYRLTASYTEENGLAIIDEIELRKDGKIISVKLEKVSGKDAADAADKLFDELSKSLEKLR